MTTTNLLIWITASVEAERVQPGIFLHEPYLAEGETVLLDGFSTRWVLSHATGFRLGGFRERENALEAALRLAHLTDWTAAHSPPDVFALAAKHKAGVEAILAELG